MGSRGKTSDKARAGNRVESLMGKAWGACGERAKGFLEQLRLTGTQEPAERYPHCSEGNHLLDPKRPGKNMAPRGKLHSAGWPQMKGD